MDSRRDGDDRLPDVPGYEVLQELGRGGAGVVYLARQHSPNRLVALKVMTPNDAAGPKFVARFTAEAEAIGRLQHPCIVQVYGVGEHRGRPYFAMEYVPGGTLHDRLDAGPLPPAEAGALVGRLARAMHHAHDFGVIHRDLKPSNVLIAADGTPKVVDFGLAKQLDVDLTATKALLGTPSYMAPEQIGGAKSVGPTADVWALGVIFYECLTGKRPFRGQTPYDIVTAVRGRPPESPRKLNPAVPADLEAVCLRCLQKDPADRYQTAAELADDLDRCDTGQKPAAGKGPASGRVTALWLAAVAAAFLAGGAVGFLLGRQSAP